MCNCSPSMRTGREAMPTPLTVATLNDLLSSIADLRAQACVMEQSLASELERIPLQYQRSARNLVHYLALRQHDVRELQNRLTALGLSSLGRSESHVLASLDAVWEALHRLATKSPPASAEASAPVGLQHR